MSIRMFRLAAVVATLTLTLTVNAQTQRRGTSFSPSRLWDGKTPDFRGIWQVRDTAYVNIEGHAAEKGIAAARSIIIAARSRKIAQ